MAGLPLAVFTADCLAVVLEGEGIVGIAHAGWRGLAAGVITGRALEDAGSPAKAAAIGPAIGSCCFEVGEDVAGRFPEEAATTTWGSPSVDLLAAARAQLAGLELWDAGRCTGHDPGLFSHRRQHQSPDGRYRLAGVTNLSEEHSPTILVMNQDGVQGWLDRYVAAWRANDAGSIEGLFTDDAVTCITLTTRGPVPPRKRGDCRQLAGRARRPEGGRAIPAYAIDGDRAVAVGWSRYLAG